MSKNLRVLIITGSWPPIHCGVGDYTAKLTENMTKLGVDMHILTSKGAQRSSVVEGVVSKWNMFDWPIISSHINDLQPDIIHMQYPSVMYRRNLFPNFLPLLIKRKYPHIPLVLTLHEYHDASALGRYRTLITLRGPDRLILTNIEDSVDLGEQLKRKKHDIIPIGSNIEYEKASEKKAVELLSSFGVKKNKFWLYTGFVDATKGLDNLIDAINASHNKMPLVIATAYDSNNEYHKKIQQEINQNTGTAIWTDYVPAQQLSILLSDAFGVVLPFDRPATARRGSVIAALAHGKAVITTGAKGSSIFSDGAMLIPTNTVEEIVGAMDLLVQNTKEKQHFEKSAKYLANRFSWDTIAQEHLNIYLEECAS